MKSVGLRASSFLFGILLYVIGVLCAGAADTGPRTNLLQFVTPDGGVKKVRTTNDWNVRRESIIRAMQEVMGPLPGKEKRCALDARIEEETDCGSYVRRFL